MTDPVLIRFPWFTLYGMPDRPGRFARWRCVAAMLVHELVELTAGTSTAHSMRAARRYLIGAPSITVPASQRNRLYLTTVEDGFPDVYGDLVGGRVVELRVYSGGTVDSTYESIFNPGPLVEVRLSNPTTNDWDLVGGAGTDVPYLRVGLALADPTVFGGSYSADTWTIAALSAAPTTGDFRLLAVLGTDANDMSGASTGLFEHTGSGTFTRVRSWSAADAGTWIVSASEVGAGDGSPVVWLYVDSGGSTLAYSLLADLNADLTALSNRMGRFHPTNPVKPELHVSKYVTFDPDFPLDGTATHVGGQSIDNGQNITLLTGPNGGVWTLSTSGAATRATGFGAMVDTDIGNYDHVGYTGTRWAYFAVFRLYGDATQRGMSPASGRTGIIGGEGVTRSYRPDLIATDLTGDDLTILEADGTTTVVSVAAQTGTFCVLVTDTVELVTIASGAVAQTENFAAADGVWIAQGWAGNGVGATVAIADGTAVTLTGGGGGGAVDSVNGQTGDVTLTASDVGADADGTASGLLGVHVAAADPHGDRAYAAGLVDDLSGVTNPSAARTNLGLGNSATRAVGTTAGTVAAGDDSRITGAVAASIIDAKGDLIAGTAADTAARLAVGTAGQVPIADSNATPGIRWGSHAAQNGYPAWPTRSQRFYAVPRRTTGTTAMAAGFIRLIPFVHHETVTFDRIAVYTNATSTGLARLGIYLADGTAGLPSTRLLDAGEVDTSPTAGDRLITISQQLNAGQLYWLAFNCNVSTTVAHRVIDNWNEPGFGFGGIVGSPQPEAHALSTQTYGAMPATLSSPSWSNAAAPYLALRAA